MPDLVEGAIRIRPGTEDEVPALLEAISDDELIRWWPRELWHEITNTLLGQEPDAYGFLVEVDGQIAGYAQYWEEVDPNYRHAGIDIVLGAGFRDRGVGTTVVRMMAGWLFEVRGHHRIMIDPNAANGRAIRSYEKVGFRPVGVMRQYEWDHHLGRWTDALLMEMLADDLTGE
jgi:aminoglycoside 6'-N-acetyltransferase